MDLKLEAAPISPEQVTATINEEDNNLELKEVNSKGTFVTTFSPTDDGMRVVRLYKRNNSFSNGTHIFEGSCCSGPKCCSVKNF